jgi:hypothetical protein
MPVVIINCRTRQRKAFPGLKESKAFFKGADFIARYLAFAGGHGEGL